MTKSTLRAVLEIFNEVDAPLSLGYIAHSLNISPEMAESMLQFWIQKNLVQPTETEADCGSCGVKGSCPFVYKLPAGYELVSLEQALEEVQT